MRHGPEKVQNRRHRPVYLAPTAVNLQNFSTRSSYDSFGNDTYDDGDENFEDLMIPLFVEIPHDEDLRLPITSPPCSGGSRSIDVSCSTLHSPGFVPTEFQAAEPLLQERRRNESLPMRGPLRNRLYKVISSVYALVSDFLLLIFVCLMGLFFHVEVQVVKERAHGRRGRVVVQKSSAEERRQRRHEYRSTDLLRPLQQNSPSNSYLTPDDMV